jgi:hypothetical protein
MTAAEKEAFGNCLASIADDLPSHILELLQQCIDSNTDMAGDGEIEIDIQAVSDDLLFELKKQVDKYLQEREQSQQVAKSEPSENEAVNVSGLSHSSTNPCKGSEPIEEDVDICGNASPIMLDKDAQIRSSKCGSPSSSSSDSGSSSSGLCLTVFICICFYYYRHSCVKKMLLFFPTLCVNSLKTSLLSLRVLLFLK